MAKARSYDVIEYRNKITSEILHNENIVNSWGIDLESAVDVLPFRYIFPHEFVPDTVTETDKFLNFDLRAMADPRNRTYKDVTIWFFVFCHHKVSQTSTGLWYDQIVTELDNIFGEKNILGVGKIGYVSNVPYKPNNRNEFVGRLLTFTVKEFTDGLKNGR